MRSVDYYNISPEFTKEPLLEADVEPHGLDQLIKWVQEAIELPEQMPTAMALATSTFEGKASVRFVLLKRIDDNGLYFFTNYRSKKGKHLLSNPYASVVFFWPQLERQIRVEGAVVKADDQLSDDYFATRNTESKLAAWAFEQSKVVHNRKALETRLNDFREEFLQKEIERPFNWGGYCLQPKTIEFWQGGRGRMHDRLLYTLMNGAWTIERLTP